MTPAPTGSHRYAQAAYGLLGFPLAFVALPLYVHLPPFLAVTLGWSLTAAGGVLLAVRVFDAVIDPALGRWCDRLLARSPRQLLAAAAVAALLIVAGLITLFSGAEGLRHAPVVVGALVLTGCANSLLSIAHQTWGTALPGTDAARSRLYAWREGAGLAGVLVASALPTLAGWPATLAVLAGAMAVGWLAWWHAPRPGVIWHADTATAAHSPWQHRPFVALMGVFVLNGIAAAIPATLVVLFMTDRLGAPASWQAGLLGAYFASAAVGLPLWLRGVRRIGLARTWGSGMVLAVVAFSATAWLGTGDLWPFAAICVLAGLTLGADLALPGALLAQVLDAHAPAHAHRGRYVGWWALATKLNLALAAGLALPLLGLWGYAPGSNAPQALTALTVAYAGLPGVLKLGAALVLYATFIRPLSRSPAQVQPCSPS